MNTHVSPLRALAASWIRYLPQQRDHAQLLEQRCVERNFVQSIENFARGSRGAGSLDGINRDKQCVLRFALAYEGRDCRIARIAAIPIGFSFDFDGLEYRRQTGRGQENVGRNLRVAKDAAATGADIGSCYKQPD